MAIKKLAEKYFSSVCYIHAQVLLQLTAAASYNQ